MRVWTTADGRQTEVIRGHTDRIWDLAFTPDGESLATASEDGTAKVWNANKPQDREILDGSRTDRSHGSYTLVFSPNGRILATTFRDVRLWDVAAGRRAPGILAGTTRSPVTAIAIVVIRVVWYRIRSGGPFEVTFSILT